VAIENRNGRTYAYTTQRIGTRVVRKYQGSGRLATLSEQLDKCKRHERQIERSQIQLQQHEWAEELRAQHEWLKAITAIVNEALTRSGWHQARRQWRKKRGTNMQALATVDGLPWVSSELTALAGNLDPETREKASKGDMTVLAKIDAYLENPAARALWGDMGRFLLTKWVIICAGTNELLKQGIVRFASDLRDKLAGPNPNALEQLLAERVVVSWLFVHVAEKQLGDYFESTCMKRTSIHMRRVDLANRNFLSACRTLAKVRRVQLPNLMAIVNVNPPTTTSLE
jgi:hypothetical protein